MGAYLVPLVLVGFVVVAGPMAFKRFPPVVFIGVPIYSVFTKVASVGFLEGQQTFLIETSVYSADIGATERAIFYNAVSLGTALILLRTLANRIRAKDTLSPDVARRIIASAEMRWSYRVALGLLAAQLVNALASYPYPLPGSGVSRQQFAQGLRFPIIEAAVGDLVIFATVVGAATLGFGFLANDTRARRRGMNLGVLHVLYLVLIGQRFNGGVLVGCFWLATFVTVLWLGGAHLRLGSTAVRVAPIVIAMLLVGQADVADRSFAEGVDSPVEAVAYRALALQGGVSYTAELRASEGERVGSGLLTESMSTTRAVYMPAPLAAAYERRGVNLAGSLHGNSVLALGYSWGLAPLVLYGVMLATTSALVIFALKMGRFWALFPLSLLLMRVVSVNAQGTFYRVWGAPAIALLIVAVLAVWAYPALGHRRLNVRSRSYPAAWSRSFHIERTASLSRPVGVAAKHDLPLSRGIRIRR